MSNYRKRILLNSNVLKQLVSTENSCVEVCKIKKHIALFPYHMVKLKSSIKEVLNEDVGKYCDDLDGILLGVKRVKILSDLGLICDDSCFVHLDVEAKFLVFNPAPGKELPGIVTKKTKDHVGCLVYHTFNVSLPKPENAPNWTGHNVEMGQEVIIRVTFVNLKGRLPYIRGEFLQNSPEPVNKKIKFDEIEEENDVIVRNVNKKFKFDDAEDKNDEAVET